MLQICRKLWGLSSFSIIHYFLPNLAVILPALTFNCSNYWEVSTGRILLEFGRK